MVQEEFCSFFLTGAISMGLGNRCFLSLAALQFWVHRLYQSVSLWAVSAHTEEPHPTTTLSTHSEGASALPDTAWWSSEYNAITSLMRIQDPVQGHGSTGVTLLHVKCHCHFSKSYLWFGAGVSLHFGNVFMLQWYKV